MLALIMQQDSFWILKVSAKPPEMFGSHIRWSTYKVLGSYYSQKEFNIMLCPSIVSYKADSTFVACSRRAIQHAMQPQYVLVCAMVLS